MLKWVAEKVDNYLINSLVFDYKRDSSPTGNFMSDLFSNKTTIICNQSRTTLVAAEMLKCGCAMYNG